jgi:hypothetical protein
MKLPFVFCLLLLLSAAEAKQARTHHAHPAAPAPDKDKPAAAAKPSAQPATPAPAPVPAPVSAAGKATLDGYIQALTDQLSLSKDEQKDIKTYYLDDGAPLSTILNNASLSPFQQTRQVDDLRDTRNAKIEALLRDVDRQQAFLKVEADYRVALTELAANGELVPTSPPPRVPEPTATPPAEAGKAPVKP